MKIPGSIPKRDTTRGTIISCHDSHTESTRIDELVKITLIKERQVSDPGGTFEVEDRWVQKVRDQEIQSCWIVRALLAF